MTGRLTVLPVLIALIGQCVCAGEQCVVPHFETLQGHLRYEFPPEIEKNGLVFALKKIPINREDVRNRILAEINYLLLDRRSRVLLWLSRSDELSGVIGPILRKYKVPKEFIFLAAIESSYDSRALSSAGAFGYWQFIKATACNGPSGCNVYDWKMAVTKWKDERADLVTSTHSAARYLAWMNRVMKVKLKDGNERQGLGNWLLAAACYNAGPRRVTDRLNSFGVSSYWDVPLPEETEKYVPRWIAVGVISKYRQFYGVDPPRRPAVSFETVQGIKLKKDLTFAAMARLLNTNPRAVWTLNTQVPPEKAVFPARSGRSPIKHSINIPPGSRTKFISQLKANGYIQ